MTEIEYNWFYLPNKIKQELAKLKLETNCDFNNQIDAIADSLTWFNLPYKLNEIKKLLNYNYKNFTWFNVPEDTKYFFQGLYERTCNETPTAPTISEISKTDTEITIGITGATDDVTVTGYDIFIDNVLTENIGNISQYTITGLIAETAYAIKLQAKDGEFNSPDSNVLNITTDPAQVIENFNRVVTNDESYSWYSKPIAINDGGFTYSGSVDQNGRQVFSRYEQLGERTTVIIRDDQTTDEHQQPAFVKKDGIFYVFGTPRNEQKGTFRTVNPDMTGLSAETDIVPLMGFNSTNSPNGVSYNQIYVHNNRFFYFTRRNEFNWAVSWSDDNCQTWTTYLDLIQKNTAVIPDKLYLYGVYDNGIIHFTAYHHPDVVDANEVYYFTLNCDTGAVLENGVSKGNLYSSWVPINVHNDLTNIYNLATGRSLKFCDAAIQGNNVLFGYGDFEDGVDGTYKLLQIAKGTHNLATYDISNTGVETYSGGYLGSFYFQQSLTNEWNNTVFVARNETVTEKIWYVEEYVFDGNNFSLVKEIDQLPAGVDGLSLTRPITPYGSDSGGVQCIYQKGDYNETFVFWDNVLVFYEKNVFPFTEPETTAFNNKVTSLGYTALSQADSTELNRRIRKLKLYRLWPKIRSYIHFTDIGNIQTITINVKNPDTFQFSIVNALNFTNGVGLSTDAGFTGYINTNFNPSTDTGASFLTNESKGFYVYGASVNNGMYISGTRNANDTSQELFFINGGLLTSRFRSTSTGEANYLPTNYDGLLVIGIKGTGIREAPFITPEIASQGQSEYGTAPSPQLSNHNDFVFGYNNAGTPVVTTQPFGIKMIFRSEDMSDLYDELKPVFDEFFS